MFNEVKRTLSQVRCILHMKKKLISLGMLVTHGIEWSNKRGMFEFRAHEKILFLSR